MRRRLRLLLGRSLGLGSLLPVASNHDHAQERAHDGGTQENEDNGDSDGPDAGKEEVLERVVIVDERLGWLAQCESSRRHSAKDEP